MKFSPHHQWPVQKMPANIIVAELSQIVPEHAISDVQPRESVSASFLCHAQYVDELMRSSGRRGIFLKEKKGSSPELELLWLGGENDLTSALNISEKAKDGLGLAQKGPPTALRFAVRFRTLAALSKSAKEIKLEDTAKLDDLSCLVFIWELVFMVHLHF